MFSDPTGYLWLIPVLPLLGSIVTAFLGPRYLRAHSHWPCVGAAGLACLLSLLLFGQVMGRSDVEPEVASYYTWFSAGSVKIDFGLRADGLSAIMLVMVTFIGSLIAIYSIGYMHGDPGYPRYFAAVSLFLFAMILLVTADNFVLLYAAWEGVGLCSYLLIGFWFSRPAAAAAARKAFLVNRIGDIGFFLGILLLWLNVPVQDGIHGLDYGRAFGAAANLDTVTLTTICLLLFCGAIGKSAQFPLHVWLPDAMEGPSSVSALIHAATMVTAGVYMVARCTPLFALAPYAQMVVACIGGITALLAALIALTQTDLKRVLAYSTVSQLGFMFLALGSALHTQNIVALGVMAAIFHLFTHAFFKALLFLGAGSVMHAMGNVIDMRKFSGLREVLPRTHWTFVCGAAALAGLFPLSGFWSKDEVLLALWQAIGVGGTRGTIYLLLFLVALLTAGLTAFYTGRAYFMTFWGPLRVPAEAGQHGHHGDHHNGHGPRPYEAPIHAPRDPKAQVHESPPVMTIPLMILAVGALLVGIVVGPTHLFGGFLEAHWMRGAFPGLLHSEHHASLLLMLVSIVVAFAGVGVAYWMYVKTPGSALMVAHTIRSLYELSKNRFHLDEFYYVLFVQPLTAFADFCRSFDQHVIDPAVDLLGQTPSYLGKLFAPIQNGLVQFYALLMVLGLTGFLLSVLLR